MIIPGNRYTYPRNKKNKNKKYIFIGIIFLLILSSLFLLFLGKSDSPEETAPILTLEDKTLEELWTDNRYRELTEKSELILADDPLDSKSLIYNGFAYFYLGIAQFTLEDQLPLLDKAVVNLRKALQLKSHPLEGKVNYILGKTYYHKGRFYMDQAIVYIEKSIELGILKDDSYKYLGLSYSELGFYSKGIEYFLKAVNNKEDDMLFLVLGQTYYKSGDEINSEIYLKRAIELNNDFRVKIKSRFLLGKIYTETGEYKKAEKQYNLILDGDSKSADAHYFLGEIYSEMGNSVKARAEWRKVLKLDPSHYGALLRLY